MYTILVTGGTGFIGSHTAVALIEKGYRVVIIDNLSNSEAGVVDRIEQITGTRPEFVKLDLCDARGLDAFFARRGQIDAVVHFAASKAVGESVQKPLLYYRNNLLSLTNLLEACGRYGIGGFVFSSSCTVYGQPELLPVTEQSPVLKAESPYGNTKQIAEEILADVVRANPALKAIALRYFNPVGAHPSGLIGELPLGVPANLVPFITQTAAGLRPSVSVFGGDYPTPDGTAIRDYIHVCDLAEAHVVALERFLMDGMKAGYEFFNLGTGRGSSVLEVIESFERVSGLKLNYQIVGRREGDIVQIWADTSLANSELGWSAKLTLDDMMRSAWAWQQSLV